MLTVGAFSHLACRPCAGRVSRTVPHAEVAANGTSLHVRVGGQGPASCCCMALATPATCGPLSRPNWSATTRSSFPISAAWVSRAGRRLRQEEPGGDIRASMDALDDRAADRRRTTSAHGRLRLAARYPQAVTLVLMDAPVPGIGPWDGSWNPLLWHFRFGGPDWSGSWRGASASISTASGTNSPPIRQRFDEALASTTRALCPARRHARGLPQFAPSDQDVEDNAVVARARLDHAAARDRRRALLRRDHGGGDARRRRRRARGRHPECRALAMEEQPAATIAAVRSFLAQR